MSENRQTAGPRCQCHGKTARLIDDFESCYRFMRSRDPRYDGFFFVGVTSTGIYCRPSCPARLPQRRNVRLFPTAAAAQAEGFRACKRCEPDAAPGSPAWNRRADVAGRAFRLIADGIVDREGVSGLAARLGFSERQLNRILVAEVGAGPIQLARAQRAQAARTLIESTDAALRRGRARVRLRQHPPVQRHDPGDLRAHAERAAPPRPPPQRGDHPRRGRFAPAGAAPLDGAALLDFLAARAIPGVEHAEDGTYRRSLALEHGGGVVALTPDDNAVRCVLQLDDLRDLTAAVARCRRLLDLDADPVSISTQLGADPVLGELVARRPGMRVPGCVDGFELAVRAIVGQQVSVAAARTVLGRLVERYGEPLPEPSGPITHRFPTAAALAEAGPGRAPVPAPPRRGAALAGAAGTDRGRALRRRSRRAGRPDPAARHSGCGSLDRLVRGHARAGRPGRLPRRRRRHPPRAGAARATAESAAPRSPRPWRPWRSYAVMHLWASVSGEPGGALRVDDADELAERDVRVDQVQAPLRRGRRPEDRRAA